MTQRGSTRRKPPGWIKIGLKFTSIHFDGIVTVTGIDTDNNRLSVRIDREAFGRTDSWPENRRLDHSEKGFNHGDYTLKD